jgi:ADP-ribose pyrophosphatase
VTERPIQPWKTLRSTYPYQDEWVRLRSDNVLLPNGTPLYSYHTLEIPDVVNVIALTKAKEVIVVEQYRHPVGRTLMEIPAGQIGDGETPEAAARRELVEETGFGGGTWHYLGATYTMASRLSNQGHSFLAIDVVEEGTPLIDEAEIIRVHRVPWMAIVDSIGRGEPMIAEANQLAAIFLVQQFVTARGALRIDFLDPK